MIQGCQFDLNPVDVGGETNNNFTQSRAMIRVVINTQFEGKRYCQFYTTYKFYNPESQPPELEQKYWL
jgi:hypothetical protein